MRGLIPPEDRFRFERLVADIEQAIWESETVTADLARLVAIGVTEAPLQPVIPVELTDVVAGALRGIDALLASRGIAVEVHGAPAVFVLGDRDRLEHLIATSLSIAASAARPRTPVEVRYGVAEDGGVRLQLAPYRARDSRATIVEALARSQHATVDPSDEGLVMRLPAAVGAASV